MHIILGNSNNINEGYEERIPNFRDLDYVIGPDGTTNVLHAPVLDLSERMG